MDRHEHAARRSGRVTASIAREVIRRTGTPEANRKTWERIARTLWLADGSEFTVETTGARAHGHRVEPITIAHLWERHPEMEVEAAPFIEGEKIDLSHVPELVPYAHFLGCSPDGLGLQDGRIIAGIEAKSPVVEDVFTGYASWCSRGEVPPEHKDQVFFSMLLLKRDWFFVAQHAGKYCEAFAAYSSPSFRMWRAMAVPQLVAFLKFYAEGEVTEKTKLSKSIIDAI